MLRITRRTKVFVAIATCWPPIYVPFFLTVLVFTTFSTSQDEPPMYSALSFLFYAYLATLLLIPALLVFYVVHALKNPALGRKARILWAILLVAGSFLAMMIYFFKFIWPDALLVPGTHAATQADGDSKSFPLPPQPP